MIKHLLTVGFSLISMLSFSKQQLPSADSEGFCTNSVTLNGDSWRLATDSANKGIALGWYNNPPVGASRPTKVPWVIQDIFHDYHGVAWYWREFTAPAKLANGGRLLIKFHTVDYMAEVWVNGKKVGAHEGGEFAFEVDITDAVKYSDKNLLVVRVLNPDYEDIDGIIIKETPSSLKHHPYTSNAVYNSGGITGDVELLSVAVIRVAELFIMPDWKTGKIKISAEVSNTHIKSISSTVHFKVSEARSGRPLVLKEIPGQFARGSNHVEAELKVTDFKLWSPGEPFLYRITVSIERAGCVEEQSVRFGFRDFRFENGFYQLNGKRIFLIGSNSSTHYPVGYTVPLYEEMLRRDVVNMKALGQNFVRIPFGCPNPRIFDIYDELGILVHQEHYGSWQMNEFGGYIYNRPERLKDSLLKRFENSLMGVIRRDRNHPSIVMWGALNENHDGIVFRKAVEILPKLRALDPTRLFVLNSGRFDLIKEIGSMSSPGSQTWDVGENKLKDWHPYVMIPYTRKALDELSGRIPQGIGQKIYISESGLCFPIDLPSELGDYQRWGKSTSDDALYFKRQYDKFMTDWKKFGLGDNWIRPEDYIRDAYRSANGLREIGEAAIRANPAVVAYTPTNGVADYSMGESIATNFRRLKPDLLPSVLLANTPLRWCLSTEPQSIYSGEKVQVRASFSNLDVLPPGRYPATVQVVGPDKKILLEKKIFAEIPKGNESPFAQSVFMEDVAVKGIPGKYQFLATLDSGGTALGGKTEFYVTDRAPLPALPKEIVLCGEDSLLSAWLKSKAVKTIPFNSTATSKRNLFLISGKMAQDSLTMLSIAKMMARGSAVIFLSPATLNKGEKSTGWLPLRNKGIIELVDHVAGYYRADRWTKKHPVFDGLPPAGGMIDYVYFRNLISIKALCQEYNTRAKPAHTFAELSAPLDYPDETIVGATRISHNYASGIQLGAWKFGHGRFIVNTLNITENLGLDPAADLLFSNILRFATLDMLKPVEPLPPNMTETLKEIGYQQ
ncbi:glycoside hydrolase family 2 protein [Flavihumibacter fluvii]|uniref:glycoside hydrolase family 2 protein n=1 Tax=Flavihumibacter fluvii TaxID=2838157 RepID=UPI001BDEE49E|nr:sugar-binding domain-containing protein [Flavihumibacter fluvii]ULQ51963.1 hypothetical protein KJS93_17880 [Flavihumibacter fluvii]